MGWGGGAARAPPDIAVHATRGESGGSDESYTVRHMEVFGLPENPAILVTASKAVHLLSRDSLGWKSVKLDSIAETANAVVLQEADGWWAAIAGKATTKIPLVP